jgi:hypothetical protein
MSRSSRGRGSCRRRDIQPWCLQVLQARDDRGNRGLYPGKAARVLSAKLYIKTNYTFLRKGFSLGRTGRRLESTHNHTLPREKWKTARVDT